MYLDGFMQENMHPGQTDPLGFIVFAVIIKLIWSAFKLCNRSNKLTTFSGQKFISKIRIYKGLSCALKNLTRP